jgi:hypothetical protein
MNSNRAMREILQILFAILILLMVPGIALAQHKNSGGGGGGSAPPHPSPPPPSRPSTPSGGSTNHGSGNTGGSTTGGTGHSNTGGSSNPYGSYGNKGGAGSTTGGSTGGSHSSNPYGSYGNKPSTTTGGTNTGHGTTNTFGSTGNKGNTTNTGTTRTGTTGIGTSHGGTNGSLNSGTRGGTNNSLNGKSKGVTLGGDTHLGGGSNLSAKGGAGSAGHGFGTPPGGHTAMNARGDQRTFNSSGHVTSITTRNGAAARFDSHGHINTIHNGGMTINHGGRGGRTVVTERADHSRLVSYGHGRGYGERSFSRGGHEWRNRTYYRNGRYYGRAYRGYYWHGYRYYGYVPGYYYNPGFYGWAYNPWGAAIAYNWGWGGTPWYGYSGYYFSPYASYPSAAFWLTDYLMAQNLQAAYEAQQADASGQAAADYSAQNGGGGGGGQTQLTPEVKQAISDEVASQIAAEKAQAGNQGGGGPDPAPAALDPNHRTFVVATTLSVQNADGTGCSLSSGDVLRRIDDTADSNNNVGVRVVSSQRGDCSAGAQVPVGVDDLQDMHNHLREQVDDGLAQLSKNQGHGGLPSGPAGNPQANPDGQAQPDTSVGSDLDQQQQQADQTEQDVKQSENATN